MIDCVNCELKGSCILYRLIRLHPAFLEERREIRNLKRNELLFKQGLTAGDIGVVQSGWFKQVLTTGSGDVIVDLKFPGDTVGIEGLLQTGKLQSSYMSMTNTSVCIMSAKWIRELLMEDPKVTSTLIDDLVNQLSSAYRRVPSLTKYSTMCRIVHTLFTVGDVEEQFHFSREDLASYVGSTRETVTRSLGVLRRAAAIDINSRGAIKIINSEILQGFSKK